MSKIKISNPKSLSFIILLLCLISIFDNANLSNKIFWIIITVASLFINKFLFRFKSFLLSVYALGLIYIQFVFNQHVVSEEFFINCLGVLLIVKFAELNNKDNLLSVSIIQKTKASETDLKNYVKDRLENIYGGEFNFLKYFDIEQATISHPVNSFGNNIKNYADKGIYFSGDNLVHGSIEGAVISGIKVIDDFKRSFN